MRSFNQSASSRGPRPVHLLVIAALVILGRAPFLLHADRFFDSDEAVEGLMARHVLEGEYPAFLWGQHYKGVPEVYLAAAVFAVAGSSVVGLKSVTLACFALFVCLQFILVERLFARSIAWLSTAFLIVAPPSLVLWSLSANAEIVMTLLAGTVMCLGLDVWRRTGSRIAFLTIWAAAGFGLWVQQFILYYVLALALAVLHSLPRRAPLLRELAAGREMPAWLRTATALVAVVSAVYLVLGGIAFLTGGFDVSAFGAAIGVHHAQKLWQIAAALFVLAALARIFAMSARRSRPAASMIGWAALAFAAGYGPALAAQASGGGSPPIGRADVNAVASAVGPLFDQIVPIVAGFKTPSTAWLGISGWFAWPLALAIGASLIALRERPFTPFFHLLLFAAPVMFLLSGAFVDAQSYRYLMPAAGALAVVLALGVWRLFRWSRLAGAVALAAILGLFGAGQLAWYRQLAPDVRSPELIACLDRAGVRAAVADYWLSYKLTFISGERIIVAPENGVDRYPPYTAHVRAQRSAPRVPEDAALSCDRSTSAPR